MGSYNTSELIRVQNFRQAKVLIINNDPNQLALIEYCLKECLPEVEPVTALNEIAVQTYLSACSQDEHKLPKLILLDIFMPNREDGWHILDGIKAFPSPVNQIPVVIFSQSNQPADIGEAYDRGSSSYLVKPANESEWLTCFQRMRKYWWETVSLPPIGYRY
ncbi:response regulator [Fibrella arboris]|uniref:response regulator n=1 Tax=Fibrella arboris TaxID=3242486 RepID=UPI003522CE06